jgi:WD40 repeat protein
MPACFKQLPQAPASKAAVRAVVFSGGKVFTAGADNTIKIWEFQQNNMKPVHSVTAPGDVWCMDVCQGVFLFAGCQTSEGGLVKAWNMTSGQEYELRLNPQTPSHLERVYALAANATSGILFSGGGRVNIDEGSDPVIRVWSLDGNAFKCVSEMKGHRAGIKVLKFIANDQLLVSGSFDGCIGVWNASNGQMIGSITQAHQYQMYAITSATVSGSEYVFTAGNGSNINVYQLQQDGSLQQAMVHSTKMPKGGSIFSMTVVADKAGVPHLICGQNSGHVMVMSLPNMEGKGLWRPHQAEVNCMASWPENHAFFLASFDNRFSCYYYK